jgi:hypothetical protein
MDDETRDEREADGQGLLLVDLLRLHRRFSFRRYREDLVGFGVAWVVVAALIALAWWCARVGG